MEERVLNRAARDQEFIMNIERASGEKASDYESNEAFLEQVASNVYDNVIRTVRLMLRKEDESVLEYADRLCFKTRHNVSRYSLNRELETLTYPRIFDKDPNQEYEYSDI